MAALMIYIGFKLLDYDKLVPLAIFFFLMALISTLFSVHSGYVYIRDEIGNDALLASQESLQLFTFMGLIALSFLLMVYLTIITIEFLRTRKIDKAYGMGYNPETQSYR